MRFDLPRAVLVEGQEILSVTIQQGFNRTLIDQLRSDFLDADSEAKLRVRPKSDEAIKFSHGDHDAELAVGDMFVSRLRLESS